MFDHLNRALHDALDGPPPAPRQPTLEQLLPGDVVSLWDGGDMVVQTVLDCTEELNQRTTTWRWNLLDENRMLETSPDGTFLYGRSVVVHQGSVEFETLTAQRDGALVEFEARVRAESAARNPVLFQYGGLTYQVTATGTFLARALGGQAPSAAVWRDLDPVKADENVYFVLTPTDAAAAPETEQVALGIWTTHIALLFGKELGEADVQAIYPRSEEGQAR
jgi:hypothetical protein